MAKKTRVELMPNTKDIVDAFHYITESEALLLQKYAEKLPKSAVCINIGAGTGTSSMAVLEKRPDLTKTFYTIDIRDWDNPFGGLLNERNSFDKFDMDYPNQIFNDSKVVADEWEEKSVDLLIIDGDHSRIGARGDILGWKKKLKDGAIVFVHDYDGVQWSDVREIVDECMRNSDDFEYLDAVDGYIVFRFIEKG